MKERPILFNGDMVRAILEGRKTQTRRVVKVAPPEWIGPEDVRVESFFSTVVKRGEECEGPEIFGAYDIHGEWGTACPFGKPGDRLWVRETWAAETQHSCGEGGCDGCMDLNLYYAADHAWRNWVPAPDDWTIPDLKGNFSPAIMPRWASRITLEITGVRVERLQDISENDAEAEGCSAFSVDEDGDEVAHYWKNQSTAPTSRAHFAGVWNSAYERDDSKRWSANPWVWVIEFRRVT